MALDRYVAEAATYGDVDFIEAWLQNLDSPEDINEVDAKGRTVLSLCAKGYNGHFNNDGDGPSIVAEQSITAIAMILAKGGADVNLGDDQARDEGTTGHVPMTVPYFPTREILTGKVGLSVDGDVEDVTVHLEVVYHAITAMREYSGKSFEELRLEETYQEGRDWGNRLRRVCADCGRSLTRENYSNTQLKKRVGISRCKDCVVRVWPT